MQRLSAMTADEAKATAFEKTLEYPIFHDKGGCAGNSLESQSQVVAISSDAGKINALSVEQPVKASNIPVRDVLRQNVGDWFLAPFSCIQSLDQAFVFVCYVVIYIMYVSYVHTMTPDSAYSPPVLVIAVLFLKLGVSIIAALVFEFSPLALLQTIITSRRHLLLYIFPASAYAATDALSIYSLRFLDPGTFGIVYHLRIVFTLILYERWIHIRLKLTHWVAMGCILIGCIIKEIPTVLAYNRNGAVDTSSWRHVWGIFIVLCMAQIVAFAAVYNEKLLKNPLSLNVQNIGMYSFGLLTSLVFFWLSNYSIAPELSPPPTTQLTDVILTNNGTTTYVSFEDSWSVVWSFPVVGAAFLNAIYGLVTSYFVRALNTIVREIASVLQVVGMIVVNSLFVDFHIRFTDLMAMVIMLFSVWVYNRKPLVRCAPPAEVTSGTSLESQSASKAEPCDRTGSEPHQLHINLSA